METSIKNILLVIFNRNNNRNREGYFSFVISDGIEKEKKQLKSYW